MLVHTFFERGSGLLYFSHCKLKSLTPEIETEKIKTNKNLIPYATI